MSLLTRFSRFVPDLPHLQFPYPVSSSKHSTSRPRSIITPTNCLRPKPSSARFVSTPSSTPPPPPTSSALTVSSTTTASTIAFTFPGKGKNRKPVEVTWIYAGCLLLEPTKFGDDAVRLDLYESLRDLHNPRYWKDFLAYNPNPDEIDDRTLIRRHDVGHLAQAWDATPRPIMSLRVSYVNVQGLSANKFDICYRLLDTIYDFLFVAETWFIDHHVRRHDRRFLASTPKPRHDRGRPSGGIYLLGTKHTRSIISNVNLTRHSITFTATSIRISGVYFPPTSITDANIAAHLVTLHSSSIVIRDINIRFRNTLLQESSIRNLF
ncbi:hypothetical protein DL98DRAFT_598000 [Cadophora sp. DSE1049]|nr:hypothetical protein DL98DRAFT_598000 [Cadophora sp. DSE1049]